MQEHELRATLRQIMEDIDAGRVVVPRPSGLGARLGSTLCVAALGLGLAACPGKGPTQPPGPGPTPTAEPTMRPAYGAPFPGPGPSPDPGATVEYMAPDPGTAPPIDTGPRPLYAVQPVPPNPGPSPAPAPSPTRRKGVPPISPDPGPTAEYMAPGPGIPPPIDTAPRPLYGVETVPLR